MQMQSDIALHLHWRHSTYTGKNARHSLYICIGTTLHMLRRRATQYLHRHHRDRCRILLLDICIDPNNNIAKGNAYPSFSLSWSLIIFLPLVAWHAQGRKKERVMHNVIGAEQMQSDCFASTLAMMQLLSGALYLHLCLR